VTADSLRNHGKKSKGKSEDRFGFPDYAPLRGNSAQVEASVDGFVLRTNLVPHLKIEMWGTRPQRARQGWGTQFCGWDRKGKIKGGPPADA
jgi:hypothetical protein